ncbi:MAG: hypothetical protein ACTSSP_08455 [Candidatus Asgardarchaeia archaeon]
MLHNNGIIGDKILSNVISSIKEYFPAQKENISQLPPIGNSKIINIKESSINAFLRETMLDYDSEEDSFRKELDGNSRNTIPEIINQIPLKKGCVLNGDTPIKIGNKIHITQSDHGNKTGIKLEVTTEYEIFEHDNISVMMKIHKTTAVITK